MTSMTIERSMGAPGRLPEGDAEPWTPSARGRWVEASRDGVRVGLLAVRAQKGARPRGVRAPERQWVSRAPKCFEDRRDAEMALALRVAGGN